MDKPFSELSNTYETIYDSVKPQIYVESLLTPVDTLKEYKVWCFNGEPLLIQIQLKVDGFERSKFYDLNWVECPCEVYYPTPSPSVPAPKCLHQLVELSKTLSKGFPFVRVDLHVSGDNGITFSELTFHPGGGRIRFYPREYDFELGTLLDCLVWDFVPYE
jgi:hypothetical protein